MIKSINSLTEQDKHKYYEAVKADFTSNYGLSWDVIERSMQDFIDRAFDDEKFCKMDPDDQIDASYCRKAFGTNMPDIADYLIWMAAFTTHSEYIEIPD